MSQVRRDYRVHKAILLAMIKISKIDPSSKSISNRPSRTFLDSWRHCYFALVILSRIYYNDYTTIDKNLSFVFYFLILSNLTIDNRFLDWIPIRKNFANTNLVYLTFTTRKEIFLSFSVYSTLSISKSLYRSFSEIFIESSLKKRTSLVHFANRVYRSPTCQHSLATNSI